jgi:hypothetical protein
MLLLYVQSLTPDDGGKVRPKHVECHSKQNKFETSQHLVGFTIEIYYNARPYEWQLRLIPVYGTVTSWNEEIKSSV